MNHTPGPWKVGVEVQTQHTLDEDTLVVEIINSDGEFVACCNEPNDAYKANAQLIATAPELLNALETCVEIIKNEYPECQWNDYRVDKFEALISKVKGE